MNFSATVKADEMAGSLTIIDVTIGHVCSPLDGMSLDWTRKPAPAACPGGSVRSAGGMAKTGPSPVVRTVA